MGAAMVLVLTAGCSGTSGTPEAPARPANVAAINPCDLLTDQEKADLRLKVDKETKDGHRRSCTLLTTRLLDDSSGVRMGSLELVLRDSAAPNRVADAKRIAESFQRERSANLVTTNVDGREVYQVGPVQLIGCRVFFQVNATSSLEVAPVTKPESKDCAFPDLTRQLAAKLPAPDPAPVRADRDRPVDVRALDPCALISTDRKASMRLGEGNPSTEVVRSCRYSTGTTTPGSLEFVSVSLWTSGAKGQNGETSAVRVVNERNAYEKRPDKSGVSTISDCEYRLEVTTATSVHVRSQVLGANNVEPACAAAAEVAADIEPRLPLIVT